MPGRDDTNPPAAYTLEASIVKEIERSFAAADRDYISAKLANTGLPMGAVAPPPRVHAAILWLARGNRAKFDEVLAGACADWRDTLVAAGLASQNWKLVLDRRGIECEHWPAGPAQKRGHA
ncbi:MAG: hypothetical protein OEW88_08315 [Gammaproteobacteria bacterium]|nr:hypothetical protein [Gammaproteobacteria bacterium]MDH5276413.1 hypothetical protein [Gammaproteobacteria bacterium]